MFPNKTTHHVVVLGANPKPHRYSNQAVRLLLAGGYKVPPVSPVTSIIEGLTVAHRLADIKKRRCTP